MNKKRALVEFNDIDSHPLADFKKTIQRYFKEVSTPKVFKNLCTEVDDILYEKGIPEGQKFLFYADRFCTHLEGILLSTRPHTNCEKGLYSFINELITTIKKVKQASGVTLKKWHPHLFKGEQG